MSNSIVVRQDARQIRRIAVRRSPIHGRGVFALRRLHAEELLVEYAGERVDWTIAASRPPADPDNPDLTYFFDIGDGTVIDGAAGGNSSRWINHSCGPNCEAVDYGGRIFICALRAIGEGEELSIDYGLMVDGRVTRALRERFACRCGAPNCRGTLLALRAKKRRGARRAHAEQVAGTLASQASPTNLATHDIRVLARPEPDRIVVSFRRTGQACYTEHVWIAQVAAVAGVCAISGVSFEAGEEVFGPTGTPMPSYSRERIAACSIQHVEVDEVARA